MQGTKRSHKDPKEGMVDICESLKVADLTV